MQTDYNQLVWIPVDNSPDEFNRVFKRTEGYFDGILDSMLNECGEADASGENSDLKANKIEENSTTKQEAIAMYASVKDYGGFYIGRYEAGVKENKRAPGAGIDDDVVIKKNKHVYNYIGWSYSDSMDVVDGGAVQKAREMTFDNSNIDSSKTTLCYGVQWDATLNFIDPAYITKEVDGKPNCITGPSVDGKRNRIAEASYVANSENKGWYLGVAGNADHKTGIDLSNSANSPRNIYDMAGNVSEWTMESAFGSDRVVRGGSFNFPGDLVPASCRGPYPPSGEPEGEPSSLRIRSTGDVSLRDDFGFRVTLYL